ncbi:hypothetical protein [Rhizobium sp. RCC_161_2]|uniref:hypothetical protein n=1 Tax=Rhizobium sp. RCC_161_2 TaxID=3239219 RepID=UPI0035242008
MVDIPDDIMRAATEIVDRIAKYHTWKDDCVADVASALLAERQRTDSLKALCDEMAKDFVRIEALNYKRAAVNGAAYEAHVIAYCALDRYREAQEVGNG